MTPLQRQEWRQRLIVVVFVVVMGFMGYTYWTSTHSARSAHQAQKAAEQARHAVLVARSTARFAIQREHETRRELLRVCRSVNTNSRNLTREHARTQAFLLGAMRARLASARTETGMARRDDLRAAQTYRRLALTYVPARPILCRVPRVPQHPPGRH